EYSQIYFAGAQLVEEDRSDFFDHRQPHLGEFSREPCEALGKKVGRDRRDDTDRDGAAHGIFLLGDVAASGFELAKDSAGPRQKSLPRFCEAHGAAQAVKEARAKLVFELHDLLRQRWLRNMRLLGGPAE